MNIIRLCKDVNGLVSMEYLQKTIDYIEENIRGPITLDECARVCGFSKFHFHRLFSIHLGMTLCEYTRRRRLCYAMLEVIQGRRILDIALDYGYSSERAFSRAFLQEFGQIPSRCRNAKYSIPSKPVLSYSFKNWNGGVQMDYLSDVSIVSLPEMTVASGARISRDPEDEVIAYMTNWAGTVGIGSGTRQFGFDVPVSDEEQSQGLRGYEYWVVVDENLSPAVLPADITMKQVESCKYAVLRIMEPFVDPFERIPLGWRKIAEWVHSRGYQAACDKERYWLEEKLEIDGSTLMDIYFPIE